VDPLALIPAPDSIPVHWGWLHFFFLLTFVLHLLFMNAMLGTGIIALVKSLKGTRQDLPIAKEISLKLPYTIAFTINMGVAPLLFIQVLYGNFIYTSSVLMGWYWLSIIGILIIAYYSAYLFDFKFDTLGSARSIFIAVCVILMLLVAFLFTSNITLMLTPEKWVRYFSNAGGTILNLSEPTLIPRFLHFVCASIAIGGLFLDDLFGHEVVFICNPGSGYHRLLVCNRYSPKYCPSIFRWQQLCNFAFFFRSYRCRCCIILRV